MKNIVTYTGRYDPIEDIGFEIGREYVFIFYFDEKNYVERRCFVQSKNIDFSDDEVVTTYSLMDMGKVI